MVDYSQILKDIGNKAGEISGKVIEMAGEKGIETSQSTGKILFLLVIAISIWLVTKFAGSLSKPIKFIIIILLGILAVSIFMSFR